MNMEKFLKAYNEPRNGANQMIRHPLVRNMLFSDGVQDCVAAGMYWMLDIVATEGCAHLKRKFEDSYTMLITFKVNANGNATLTGEVVDDDPAPWVRNVDWTDCAQGEWKFYLAWDGQWFALILLTEY
jgi:hypothetical protein